MKKILFSKYSITQSIIFGLGSLLLSSFYVFERYYQWSTLLWLVMSLVIFVGAIVCLWMINAILYRFFKIRVSLLVLSVCSFIFYFYLLKFKIYNTPSSGLLVIIILLSIVTLLFGVLLDLYRENNLFLLVILGLILSIFYGVQLGEGFSLRNEYSEFVFGIVNDFNLNTPETTEFSIIDFDGPSVDLCPLLCDQRGIDYKSRENYLGYGYDEIPIKGRLYLPQSKQPVPFMIMIHGNHKMVTPSYLGYDYLGQYLASRGYAFISLDQRALNGYLGNNLKDDNPARAIHLLESIKFLKRSEYPLSFNDITLAGHSRGGEAIVIATTFNQLKHYPENEELIFDYEFDIENLIAVSPTYQQYRLHRYPTDINYISLHGAHDQDVRTFRGQYAYQRINVDQHHFKSNWYIAKANHGQFNSEWGRYDTRMPKALNTNTANLMSESEQQAFLEKAAFHLLQWTHQKSFDSLELFVDFHSFSAQFAKTWVTQQTHFGNSVIHNDFEAAKHLYEAVNINEEIVTLKTRDTEASRLDKVLKIETNSDSFVTFEVNEDEVDRIGFDIALERSENILVEIRSGHESETFLLSDIAVVSPPYPVTLSKWEIIFGIKGESIMLETVYLEPHFSNIDSLTFHFDAVNTIYLDNIMTLSD